MELFVEYEIHEYMDMHPSINVITFKGDNIESIKKSAIEYAEHMNHNYSGGTTRFIKVMSSTEARSYLDKEIAKITHPDAADRDWIEDVNNLYNKCYKNDNC